MSEKIKVVQYGMGPVGNKITRYLLERDHLALVGAVDIDPAKVGKDVAELAGLPAINVSVSNTPGQLFRDTQPDVVVLTTTSDLEKIQPQIDQILSHGINIVTTCEELAYPWKTNPGIAAAIDQAAKANNATVLSTGVNPGFMMDYLPVTLSAVCRNLQTVRVDRIQNAGERRLPFQQKVGVGITTDEFYQRVASKTLRHVGLTESIHMIADMLGWELSKTEDIVEPVIAENPVKTAHFDISAGRALGVNQVGRGYDSNGKEIITLTFVAALGVPESLERIVFDGDPGIEMKIPGGVNGDVATCAINVNAIPTVNNADPGLKTMVDIAAISCFRS